MPAAAPGETYFFRDHGQIDLLRLRLLPELIERRRQRKALRLWSAGCASGEEPYSLAMLLDMLLPERDDWDILILGSDIDNDALEKARRGRYGRWSFRMVPPGLQQRFFRQEGDEWVLDERIRRMVTFRTGDLISEPFPGADLKDMDLILCRNVFIYFSPEEVTAVAAKLAASLDEGGYLMVGHTELIGHAPPRLVSRLFAQGVVYQRPAGAPAQARAPAAMPRPMPPPAVAPARPQPVPPAAAAPGVEDLLAAARTFADRGEYARAEQACRAALAAMPLAAAPYFLLAQLAQIRGDFEGARALLNNTLYLDPRHVAAHLELAALCERAEDMQRALTLRRAALAIVRALPDDEVIEPYETTAGELAPWLDQRDHSG